MIASYKNYHYFVFCIHAEDDFNTFLQMTVPVSPMLLTVTGLPNCGKTKIITETLKLKNKQDDGIALPYYSIITGVSNFKNTVHVQCNEIDHLIFGLQAGLMYNDACQNIPRAEETMPNDSKHMQDFLNNTFRHLQYFKDIQATEDSKVLPIDEKRLLKLLRAVQHGVALMNIWDVPISGNTWLVLESLSQLFTRNFMLVFLSLDRDLRKLQLPPAYADDPIPPAYPENPFPPDSLKWRSRVEYLLCSCQMAFNSKTNAETGKKVCKIVATYESDITKARVKNKIDILQEECNNVAHQMGLDGLIDFHIIPVNCNDPESILEDHISLFMKDNRSEEIPLSWFLLRGFCLTLNHFILLSLTSAQ